MKQKLYYINKEVEIISILADFLLVEIRIKDTNKVICVAEKLLASHKDKTMFLTPNLFSRS
jgi:hypothetical protein